MELILNNVLLALQLSLGLWQFMKLTPVGAVIQALIGWLLRPLGFSPNYSLVQHCPGRVFKRANCFALQADIPSDRRDIVSPEVHSIDIVSPEVDLIQLNYLDRNFLLERRGVDRNMLIINEKMCYYITDTIWEELQSLKRVLHYSLDGPPMARVAVAQAAVKRTVDARAAVEGATAKAAADAADAAAEAAADASSAAAEAAADAAAAIYFASDDAAADTTAAAVAAADTAATVGVNDKYIARFVFDRASVANDRAAEAKDTAEVRAAVNAKARAAAAAASAAAEDRAAAAADAIVAAAADATAAATAARAVAVAEARAAEGAEARAAEDAEATRRLKTVFVKGNKQFWAEMITGGVMTLEEVFDALILYNQHVGGCLTINWLLPVNLSVSEEKLLKILNLFALFLQTKKVVKVHWFIPTLLTLTSALLEFNTRGRVWLYTHINLFFCYMMHFICDRLPRSWRRQVYSLGKWVENLTPCNDIQLKVVRDNISAIITEGAKVDKVDKEGAKVDTGTIRCNMCSSITEGANVNKEPAILVPFLNMAFKPFFGVIEEQFFCGSIMISCIYVIDHHLCEISAPKISVFFVKCKNEDHFRRIITLVLSIAENSCGSLISYDPNNNKVRVRGFEESLTSYVNSGLPSIYKLELMNVVVA
jgi:hypothetical protein